MTIDPISAILLHGKNIRATLRVDNDGRMRLGEPWDRQVDEPGLWYARFEAYRLLGPARTLEGVYRATVKGDGRPGQAWREAAARWAWQARAEAWDAAERERVRRVDLARRSFERERRLALIDKLLRNVEAVMDKAGMPEVDQELARKLLPVMRGLLRDLLAAQRVELGEENGEDGGEVTFTADELNAAMRRVRGVALAVGLPLESGLDGLRNVLSELYPDESSIRRVAQEAGLNMGRVRMQATAVDTWHSVLMEAVHSDRAEALFAVVLREYGAYRPLRWAVGGYRETTGGEDGEGDAATR